MDYNDYLLQKPDCNGCMGHSTDKKLTAAFRMLAYEIYSCFVSHGPTASGNLDGTDAIFLR